MKPILFNTDMVRAILEGRKTVTRRVVKGYSLEHLEIDADGSIIGVYDQHEGCVRPVMDFAPYHPGDILYVRETWYKDPTRYMYKANYSDIEKFFRDGKEVQIKWRPSIHMPKEAARLFLRVTDVRVERLQDINGLHAKEEGCEGYLHINPLYGCPETVHNFKVLWNSTIKTADLPLYGWDANPWVWVIEFERVSKEAALKGGESDA